MSDIIHLKDLSGLMREVLESGGEFTFLPGGESMLPMLVPGRDSVSVIKPSGRLKKYDLPLYRRDDGSFVLHRVIKVLPDGYVMRGDSQYLKEPVRDEQITALLSAFTRKGRRISAGSFLYRAYCRIWVNVYPLRRLILHFYRKAATKNA